MKISTLSRFIHSLKRRHTMNQVYSYITKKSYNNLKVSDPTKSVKSNNLNKNIPKIPILLNKYVNIINMEQMINLCFGNPDNPDSPDNPDNIYIHSFL